MDAARETVPDSTAAGAEQARTQNASPQVLDAGRVAVVTGAASGIGLALTRRFLDRGMRVVMADVEEPALEKLGNDVRAAGGEVVAAATDVADRAAVERLRDRALAAYGAVHVTCLNAGVSGPHGALWESPGTTSTGCSGSTSVASSTASAPSSP